MRRHHFRTHARVGLLGNPSDLYGGRGLGFTVEELELRLTLEELDDGTAPELDPFLAAGWRVFCRHAGLSNTEPRFALRSESSIPFQSGLSGSSALLIAALRAFAHLHDVALAPHTLAELAWRAEVGELGIRAGPLDRLVQAHRGLIWMDWSRAFEPGAVERLDATLLPPLLIAWHAEPGEPSGAVHEPVYERWRAGDSAVTAVMEELAAVADRGRLALVSGDRDGLCDAVNRNFDLRASLFSIDARDRELIELGRALGAATKFCGSGGSVLALPGQGTEGGLDGLQRAYEQAGFRTLIPSTENPDDG